MESLVSELFILEQKTGESNHKVSISLSDFCKDIIIEYLPIADEKSLTIEYCEKGDFSVSVERSLLQKVVGNILKNALLYTEVGVVSIKVDAANRSVMIEDTGI